MNPRTTSHRPRRAWRALRDASLTQGWISDPSSTLHGPHCLSHDLTWSAKPALELGPSMQQYMDSKYIKFWVWLLVGLIKCSWPSGTLWLVFANPVTNICLHDMWSFKLKHAFAISTQNYLSTYRKGCHT